MQTKLEVAIKSAMRALLPILVALGVLVKFVATWATAKSVDVQGAPIA